MADGHTHDQNPGGDVPGRRLQGLPTDEPEPDLGEAEGGEGHGEADDEPRVWVMNDSTTMTTAMAKRISPRKPWTSMSPVPNIFTECPAR